MAHLIVTRPNAQAQNTIETLEQRGHLVSYAPLTELKPLAHSGVLPYDVNTLIATSSNALKFAQTELLEPLSRRSIYCVGSKTARLAIALGLDVKICCETAKELARVILSEPDQRFAYLCSKHRMSTLDDSIIPEQLHVIETYEAPFIKPNIETSTPVDGVLLYSIRAAQAWANAGIQAKTHFCFSHAIANFLSKDQQERAYIATNRTNLTY